jgi:hypothetical protein
MLRRVLREPLVHFLALGLALFVLYDAVSGSRGGTDRRIVVDDAAVAAIVRMHEAAWKRPPSPAELKGLVDAYVREEVLYREGVAMRLDRDDLVIRRRVQQKIVVLTEETGAKAAPTDAELEAYLSKHADRYARPAIIGFDQVMFDPMKRGAALRADVDVALARLRAGASPDAMGDSALLPVTTDAIATDLLARDYGESFAASVIALPIGSWSGPVASGYGAHLVRVNRRTPGRQATLPEARAAVERDWENDRRTRASEAYYQDALRKYDVVIDAKLPAVAAPGAGG